MALVLYDREEAEQEMEGGDGKMEAELCISLSTSCSSEAPSSPSSSSTCSVDRVAVRRALQHFEMLRSADKAGRADLNAGKAMRQQGMWLNRVKYFGHVPGVEVGDVFHFRVELCIVGLHGHIQGGISWIGGDDNKWGEPVANSIVLSGGYEDDDSGERFVYHGAGGNHQNTARPGCYAQDQSLDRGNLALANAFLFQVPIRVIRGIESGFKKKSYRYDGLFRVTRYWDEVDGDGWTVYKFLVERKGMSFDKNEVAKNLRKYRTS
ncbi:histone-lysine N-methyltransferase family member SUVH9 [Selaginella moellendorffii]|nr:histone-lysine N-methyltransferase family member SUVH9 [Selaginella moellendorffii]XP_024525972.1 histone-lysine N-methyltransferase family member SUVH9 [Selaginella moellendorffii]|eukprot:XP_002965975.2 histone-lysine N-methyltransferase family member SUVH9 [Selaginella moellendorffii]